MKIVIASANPDKAAEIRSIIGARLPDVELQPRPTDVPDVVEDGATLLDNCRLKAAALAEATGLPALADDTGLEVEALGGAPGVFSARFAGPDATYASNVVKLLAALDGVADRRAQFRTVVMVRWPDGREIVAEGAVDGHIAREARGTAGFGYDPVFVPGGSGSGDDAGGGESDGGRASPGGHGRTYAEMTPGEKHARSHRGRALRSLAAALAAAEAPADGSA